MAAQGALEGMEAAASRLELAEMVDWLAVVETPLLRRPRLARIHQKSQLSLKPSRELAVWAVMLAHLVPPWLDWLAQEAQQASEPSVEPQAVVDQWTLLALPTQETAAMVEPARWVVQAVLLDLSPDLSWRALQQSAP
jgi:hypothetical protein